MKIKTIKEILPSEDLYSLQFVFEDFTDEEKFLFNKYGFISVSIPQYIRIQNAAGRLFSGPEKVTLDFIPSYKFLSTDKELLENFEADIIGQIQDKLKRYLTDLNEFVGEDLYEVTIAGELRKINEGARKALDKNSPEYKEIIEKNREAFEKLSKL